MASELRVDKIIPSSGTSIGIGTASGTIDILGNSQINTTGVITATSFSGSAANLTNIPAANITGTLPAIDGSNLTGVGVGTADSINTSGIITATAFIPTTGQLSHRNIIVNGDMRVAQRSVGPVAVQEGSNENYQTIDRMRFNFGNAAVGAANVSQSTDAPTTLGFTKSHKVDVTTVNTTATGQQIVNLFYRIEGQDLRNSGWNHLSSSSFLTLSFYFKTTRTGTSKLPIMFRTRHGTNYYYVKNVTVTDPTNWNRYTVTIPGNSNIQIDDANTTGMDINFSYYSGPDKDTSSEGSWGSTNAYSTSDSTNYFDSTSNDMFITGIQLEVGSVATPFEHRSFGDELRRCQRYYFKGSGSQKYFGGMYAGSNSMIQVPLPVTMRTTPTITSANADGGTLGDIFENENNICYYILGDTSVGFTPSDAEASAEL